MRDLISRSGFRRVLIEIQTDAEHFGNIERRTEIGSIISLLDQQPSKTNWIPVSERLPDYYERCLIYYETRSGFVVDIDIFVDKEFLSYGIKNVKAWQPLPDPYKEV